MLKVTGGAMPGAVSILPLTVLADTGDGDKATVSPLKRDELSLYTSPALKPQLADREAGQLEETVATLRRSVEPFSAWCRGAYHEIKPKVQSAAQFGSDTYGFLRNPPKDFYPRAGVIGFTGILGLFLARGSRIKKIVYPAALVTVSASLYYPEQAAAIAKSSGDSVYEKAVQSYAAVEKMVKPQSKTEKGNESEKKP